MRLRVSAPALAVAAPPRQITAPCRTVATGVDGRSRLTRPLRVGVRLLVLLVLLGAAAPAAADPSDVYREFQTTGALTCTHARADLADLVGNATLFQYADQAVLARLTLAARRALADGCYVGSTEVGGTPGADTGPSPSRLAAIAVALAALCAVGGVALRRRRNDRLAALLVALPPVALIAGAAVLAHGGGGVASITWIPFTVCLAACVGALAAVGAVPAVPRLTRAAIAASLLLAVWSAVSLVWTAAPGAGELETIRSGMWALAFVVGATFAARATGAWATLAAVAAAAVALAVAVIVQLFDGGGALFQFGRLAWPIDYSNATASLLCMGVPVAVAVAAQPGRGRAVQAAAGGAAALLLGTALLCQSRGAMVALVVAFAILLLMGHGGRVAGVTLAAAAPIVVQLPAIAHATVKTASQRHELGVRLVLVTLAAAALAPVLVVLGERVGRAATAARRRTSHRWVVAGALLLVLGVIFAAAGSMQARWAEFAAPAHAAQSSKATRFGSVSSNRYEYWAVATRTALAHPLGGLGAGAYQVAWFARRSYAESVSDAHSFIFSTAAELGLVGLALLMAVIVLPIRARARSDVSAALLATSAFAIVHAAGDWNLTIPALALPVFAILGAGTAAPADDRSPLAFASPRMRAILVAAAVLVIALAAPVAVGAWRTATADALTATHPARALAAYRSAADWDRLSAAPLIAASTLALNDPDPNQALALARRAVDREPRSWAAWNALQAAALRAGDRELVARATNRVRSLNPLAGLQRLDPPLGLPPHQPSKCLTTTHFDGPGGRDTFAELQRLGVRTWVRPLSWVETARRRPRRPRDPADRAYRWPGALDAEIAAAVRHHIEPVLYVTASPRWANGGRSPTWAPDPADFADFAVAAVRRYPQVRRWMIWSEPNRVALRPQGGHGRRAPAIYARLLDAAYGAMHHARRDVVVIGGNLSPQGSNDRSSTTPETFLQYMRLPNGRPPRLDLLGINPYSERRPDIALPHFPDSLDIDDLDWLVLRADQIWPGRHVNLFVSEFGWLTEPHNSGWLFTVSRAQQAKDLTLAYELATNVGRVDTMCWFLLRDVHQRRSRVLTPTSNPYYTWTSGLELADGTHKPSYKAFESVPSGPVQLR